MVAEENRVDERVVIEVNKQQLSLTRLERLDYRLLTAVQAVQDQSSGLYPNLMLVSSEPTRLVSLAL